MEALSDYLPILARGAFVTTALAVFSLALATLIGGLAATTQIAAGRLGKSLVMVYTTVIRGVPDLVLLLLIYFGGQRLVNSAAGAFGGGSVSLSPFLSGVLTLGLLYGAYLAETFRGAYATVPHGQAEAARALGLSRLPLIFLVILPQVVRFALPGYVNVWQVLVKSTAVISVIGLSDLVGLAVQVGRATREPFLFLVAVLVFYLFVTWISTTLFDAADRRFARGTAGAR